MELKITNTLTRKKEVFKPIEDKKVKLYVCGVTPYDYSHLGHGRAYVNFDILVRVLKLLGYQVKYVRNITDIDDKLLNKAKEELGDITKFKQIAEKFTQFYHEDMKALNCLSPDVEPKATEHIKQMIKFIQGLVEKEKAYIVDNDVYFDISKFPEYGKLSGKKLEDLQAGARVNIDKRKKSVADFALWKGNDQNLFWKSPWGYGRPGWHIECSVMAKEHLGETIDIHGGGMDLIFPHHENEVAQSEGLHSKPFSNYWMHNAFLNINKEKMSKSLGNFFTLRQVFEKINPQVLRFFFLQHQHKTPIEFNFDDIKASETAYKKIINALSTEKKSSTHSLQDYQKHEFLNEMIQALCDDLNTPKALGFLFENLNKIKESEKLKQITNDFIKQVLGLTLKQIEEKKEITPEIKELIKKREQARKEKNWAIADQIRDQLKDMGYKLHDTKAK